MKVRVHTQGWIDDHAKAEGEDAKASIHVCLELDGRLYANVMRVAIVSSNNGFTKVVATLVPGELETVVHDKDSWAALVQDADDPDGAPRRASFRDGLRRLVAEKRP